jgi:hypothetical protein
MATAATTEFQVTLNFETNARGTPRQRWGAAQLLTEQLLLYGKEIAEGNFM